MRCDSNKKNTTTVDSVCKEKTHHDAYKNERIRGQQKRVTTSIQHEQFGVI